MDFGLKCSTNLFVTTNSTYFCKVCLEKHKLKNSEHLDTVSTTRDFIVSKITFLIQIFKRFELFVIGIENVSIRWK